MFTESLLEFSAPRNRRGWSTALSLVAEGLLLALVVVIPLLAGVALPRLRQASYSITLGPPVVVAESRPAPSPGNGLGLPTQRPDRIEAGPLRVPEQIPHGIRNDGEPIAPPSGPGIPGALGPGVGWNVTGNVALPVPLLPVRPPAAESRPLHISHMSTGSLIHEVEPLYPRVAVMTRVQGTVELTAIIARDGSVRDLKLISGNPLLVSAALDAVKQWRYRPYLLNGEPVEVETHVTVNFNLSNR